MTAQPELLAALAANHALLRELGLRCSVATDPREVSDRRTATRLTSTCGAPLTGAWWHRGSSTPRLTWRPQASRRAMHRHTRCYAATRWAPSGQVRWDPPRCRRCCGRWPATGGCTRSRRCAAGPATAGSSARRRARTDAVSDPPEGSRQQRFPRGGKRTCPGDRGQATQGGSDSRPGRLRRSQRQTRRTGTNADPTIATAACARGAFATRSQSLRADSTPKPRQETSRNPRRGPRPAPDEEPDHRDPVRLAGERLQYSVAGAGGCAGLGGVVMRCAVKRALRRELNAAGTALKRASVDGWIGGTLPAAGS